MGYRAFVLAAATLAVSSLSNAWAQPADPSYDRVEREPDGSVSIGKYLFVEKALNGLERRLKLGNERFSPALQDRLMREVLVISGLDDLRAGKISAEQFQHNMAVHLGSIPDPSTGASLYGRAKFLSGGEVKAMIAQVKNGPQP